ncbi:histidine phosphatase family protein [Paenibacillus lautus]|uniref:histidine phosphatase family protein n=1 Tax=Paenibacillus lautus TaxID=1401 RepID=UPI001BCD3988|nr:histidine phosphatase family protein [Paenibacillus lautus]
MDETATIGLIRHGITDWNVQNRAQGRSDIPLNTEGRQQAQRIAERLKRESWELIISSPLIRAKATAQIIAEEISVLDIMEDQRICEIDCGLIEGTTEEERVATWGYSWRELDLGMERFEDVAERGAQFLEEVMQAYENKHVLVVSHGAVIGLSLQKLLPQRFTTTYIDNTSLTLLTKLNGAWNCSLYNCTRHL